MTSRPVIFISAVSKELSSARDLVAKVVHLLGYEPKWQDIAATGQGDLRGVLRKWVDDSQAVIQLVGKCYGAEPRDPDSDFGRVSYTQYEAMHARKSGKPVWYFFEDEGFAPDPHEPEPEELRALQQSYHDRVRASGDLRHRFSNLLELENSILKLRDDLGQLRRRGRQWAALVLALLLLAVGGVVWTKIGQHRQDDAISNVRKQNEDLAGQNEKLLSALRDLPQALSQSAQAGGKDDDPARLAAAYAALEKKYKLDPGSLAEELPRFAKQLSMRTDANPLDRASAFYAVGNYSAAEQQALLGKDASLAAGKPAREAIGALSLAGRCAEAQYRYADAMRHYLEAAALTDVKRDPLEWAHTQEDIAFTHFHEGRFRDAEQIFRKVSAVRAQVQGSEHPSTLFSRSDVARMLDDQGRHAEAEKEHRDVLAIRTRVLGPGNLDTLANHKDLARSLDGQGRHAEAENERRTAREATLNGIRELLVIAERMQGPEHPDTLNNRNQVAIALAKDGSFAEAEKEFRTVLAVRLRTLGPEHRDTLVSRSQVANTLTDQGRAAEAEREHRDVLAIRLRVLGAEHHDTLVGRGDLIRSLGRQQKHAEAETEIRTLLEAQQRVLGSEHPDTINTQYNLADSLRAQHKYPEAERVFRAILAICEHTLGPDHPGTLAMRNDVAGALADQHRHADAEKELRTVLTSRERTLGPEHPDTLFARGNIARALADQGKDAEAEKELRQLLADRIRVLGAEDPDTLDTRNRLANSLAAQGNHTGAEQEFRTILAVRQRELIADHPDILSSRIDVALELDAQGKHAEAEAEHRAVLAIRERQPGEARPEVFDSCYHLAECLEDQARFREALAFAQRALKGYDRVYGKDDSYTDDARKLVARLQGK